MKQTMNIEIGEQVESVEIEEMHPLSQMKWGSKFPAVEEEMEVTPEFFDAAEELVKHQTQFDRDDMEDMEVGELGRLITGVIQASFGDKIEQSYRSGDGTMIDNDLFEGLEDWR